MEYGRVYDSKGWFVRGATDAEAEKAKRARARGAETFFGAVKVGKFWIKET